MSKGDRIVPLILVHTDEVKSKAKAILSKVEQAVIISKDLITVVGATNNDHAVDVGSDLKDVTHQDDVELEEVCFHTNARAVCKVDANNEIHKKSALTHQQKDASDVSQENLGGIVAPVDKPSVSES